MRTSHSRYITHNVPELELSPPPELVVPLPAAGIAALLSRHARQHLAQLLAVALAPRQAALSGPLLLLAANTRAGTRGGSCWVAG